MTTIAERVAAGAALLDEKVPGWWQESAPHGIGLAVLDLDDCESCILGQAFDEGEDHEIYCGYQAGLDVLGLGLPSAPDEYGFDGGFEEIPDLTAEWTRVITERRAAA